MQCFHLSKQSVESLNFKFNILLLEPRTKKIITMKSLWLKGYISEINQAVDLILFYKFRKLSKRAINGIKPVKAVWVSGLDIHLPFWKSEDIPKCSGSPTLHSGI